MKKLKEIHKRNQQKAPILFKYVTLEEILFITSNFIIQCILVGMQKITPYRNRNSQIKKFIPFHATLMMRRLTIFEQEERIPTAASCILK